jgi:hypothetical protein
MTIIVKLVAATLLVALAPATVFATALEPNAFVSAQPIGHLIDGDHVQRPHCIRPV